MNEETAVGFPVGLGKAKWQLAFLCWNWEECVDSSRFWMNKKPSILDFKMFVVVVPGRCDLIWLHRIMEERYDMLMVGEELVPIQESFGICRGHCLVSKARDILLIIMAKQRKREEENTKTYKKAKKQACRRSITRARPFRRGYSPFRGILLWVPDDLNAADNDNNDLRASSAINL